MSALPPAGWYDDGVTVGVVRWFDGASWTEHTRAVPLPDPSPVAPATPVQAPAVTTLAAAGPAAAAPAATTPSPAAPSPAFGGLPTGRLGQSLNLADRVTEGEAYRRHRREEALALRRRGFWMFAFAVVVLLVTGAVGIAMGGADTLWYVGAVGAALLSVRAWRDYRNATYRGAPTLSAAAWALVSLLLVVALAVFAGGPLIAFRALTQLGATVGQ